jgi:hypothetical protein
MTKLTTGLETSRISETYGGIPVMDLGGGSIYLVTVYNGSSKLRLWMRGGRNELLLWARKNHLTLECQQYAEIDDQLGIPQCAGG